MWASIRSEVQQFISASGFQRRASRSCVPYDILSCATEYLGLIGRRCSKWGGVVLGKSKRVRA